MVAEGSLRRSTDGSLHLRRRQLQEAHILQDGTDVEPHVVVWRFIAKDRYLGRLGYYRDITPPMSETHSSVDRPPINERII